jgi:hypothetical protein
MFLRYKKERKQNPLEICLVEEDLDMSSFSRNYFPSKFYDEFPLKYKSKIMFNDGQNNLCIALLTCSLLHRHTCNLSPWGLRSGGSSDETQRSGWDIVNSLKVYENVSDGLFNTSGLQLEGLMENQSCVHYLQIFVETSSATYAWTLLDE